MEKDVIKIRLTIAGRTYPISVKADKEEGFRKAAKLINDRILFYEQNYEVGDKQDSLAMVAIVLANQLAQVEIDEKDQSTETKNKLIQLHQMIDAIL